MKGNIHLNAYSIMNCWITGSLKPGINFKASCLLLAFAFISTGAKFRLADAYADAAPYSEQWDSETVYLYGPSPIVVGHSDPDSFRVEL
jgi:hypothetical protein